jgi:hypothetical protein
VYQCVLSGGGGRVSVFRECEDVYVQGGGEKGVVRVCVCVCTLVYVYDYGCVSMCVSMCAS